MLQSVMVVVKRRLAANQMTLTPIPCGDAKCGSEPD